MAGLPELNGVFGTFSGTQGLDLTPLALKQRGRMFSAQLAQEAERLAQQEALQTRGLDLQERGQDIGVSESELARQFAQNLQGMRQEFDAAESDKQRAAAEAAQQRAIQESQRAQGSAQEFQGAQAQAQRGFAGEQNEADRALRRAGLEFDRERFEKTFGMELERFNFQKDITLRDQDRADRAEELKAQMFELQQQEFASQAEQRAAQVKLVEMQTELYAQQLADAREEVDLSGSELNQIVQAAGDGDVSALSGSLLKKVMSNKKSRDAVFGLIDLVNAAGEAGLVSEQLTPEARERRERMAEAKLRDAEKKAGTGPDGKPAPAPAAPRTAEDITKEQLEPGEIGAFRNQVSADIESEQDPERKKQLNDLLTLTEGMEQDDFTIDNSLDWIDGALAIAAPMTAGTSLGLLALKKSIESGALLTRSDKEDAIVKIAEELGYDLSDFGKG